MSKNSGLLQKNSNFVNCGTISSYFKSNSNCSTLSNDQRKRKRQPDDLNSSSFKHTESMKIQENHPLSWKIITGEDLNLKYVRAFSISTSTRIFQRLEKEVEYFSGDLLKVRVYGKWHRIPRKQVSYGDTGLSYAFSGTCIPALPWMTCSIVQELKEKVETLCQHKFNFVLINRYQDGNDHMGEHRDDEKDLVAKAPIASLSFGAARDFIFKHKDARGIQALRKINPVKLELEHGSLLLMQWPTNKYWYHSLPVRKNCHSVRINLTFRDMVIKPSLGGK